MSNLVIHQSVEITGNIVVHHHAEVEEDLNKVLENTWFGDI
jgi:hypothetical protein